MNDLAFSATPDLRTEVRSSAFEALDQLERAVVNAVTGLKPGSGSAALHKEMTRLMRTNAVLMEQPPQLSTTAVAAVVQQLQPSHLIDEALEETTRAHVEALGKAGVPSSVLELLQSWVEVTVDARVVQRQIEMKRAFDSVQADTTLQEPPALFADPVQPLSAVELGRALGGLSDETVRQRERAGELFSILRPGRKRGREYPAFQAWAGIAGQPLAQVLAALGEASSTADYGFFTSTTDSLGGLTPIETLLGRLTTARSLNRQTQQLLGAPAAERLQGVVKAAEAQAAQLAA